MDVRHLPLGEIPERDAPRGFEPGGSSSSGAFTTRPSHSPFTTARLATNDPVPLTYFPYDLVKQLHFRSDAVTASMDARPFSISARDTAYERHRWFARFDASDSMPSLRAFRRDRLLVAAPSHERLQSRDAVRLRLAIRVAAFSAAAAALPPSRRPPRTRLPFASRAAWSPPWDRRARIVDVRPRDPVDGWDSRDGGGARIGPRSASGRRTRRPIAGRALREAKVSRTAVRHAEHPRLRTRSFVV